MSEVAIPQMIPLAWARDHLRNDDHPFYPYHGWQEGPHVVTYDPPHACFRCGGAGEVPCRKHLHRCDDCHGSGVVTVSAGEREDCPLCWDKRLARLTSALASVAEQWRLAIKTAPLIGEQG